MNPLLNGLRGYSLVLVALACIAARGESTLEPSLGTLFTQGLRRFEIDFGELVEVHAARFTLRSINAGEVAAEFDRSQPISEKIAVFIPRDLHGQVELQWTVPRVSGDRLRGGIQLNLQ